MSKYEQIVKLYKDGINDKNEISKKLNIPENTVKSYIAKARKEGLIEKKELKYDLVVNLYNKGVIDYDEISKKTNTPLNTVKVCLTRARKEGAIEKIRKRMENTEYKQIIDLYKSGITDYDELSSKLYIPKSTVITYISKAKKRGEIEKTKRKRSNSKYEKVIELYKSGIVDYEEIAHKTNSTYASVTTYLSKAMREGRIEKKSKIRTNTKYEQVVKAYKEGITDYKQIAEKLKMSHNTVKAYLTKVRSEIIVENQSEQTEKMNDNENKEEENVKKIGGKEERINRLKQIPLYEEIILNAKNKNITPQDELRQMIIKLNDPLKRIELAQICFLLNNVKAPQVILNGIISSTSIDENIRKTAIEEKNKIINELKARQEKINANSDIKDKKLDNSEIEK